MIRVLDIRGNPCSVTVRYGKIRHLLDTKKAKIVKREPLTIQLLYEIDNDTDRRHNMEKTIDVIITNDFRFPYDLGLDPKKCKKFTFNEIKPYFVLLFNNLHTVFNLEGSELLDNQSILINKLYVDVDSIKINYFNQILSFAKDKKVVFFRHTTTEFMDKVGIKAVAVNTIDPKDDSKFIDKKSAENTILFYEGQQLKIHKALIACEDDIVREKVFDNFEKQFFNRDMEITRIKSNNVDASKIIDSIIALQAEMMCRFKQMEENQVNFVYKIPNFNGKNKVLIIDSYNTLISGNIISYKEQDIIKQNVGSLIRLGRAAGMLVLIGQKTNFSISNEISNMVSTISIVGDFDKDQSMMFFGIDISNITLTNNSGFVNVNGKLTTYNINDIANLTI